MKTVGILGHLVPSLLMGNLNHPSVKIVGGRVTLMRKLDEHFLLSITMGNKKLLSSMVIRHRKQVILTMTLLIMYSKLD